MEPLEGLVRLSLNENLFLPRELVEEVVRKALELVDPRLYRDAYGEGLAERLAEFYGVEKSEVVVGPGADYLIYLLAHLSRERGAVIVEPTFEEYERAVKLFGAPYVKVFLDERFRLKPECLLSADASLAYMASPNNPTANQFEQRAVMEAVEWFKGVVAVDEAYAEYGRYTLVGKAPAHNLVVIRTFSKAWGLAGLRVGYAVANRKLASLLRERGRSFACSSLSLKAAELMLERWSEVRRAVEELKAVREWMRSELLSALLVRAYPSDACFILVRLPVSATEVVRELEKRGFAVRDVSHKLFLANCIRITVPPRPIAEEFIKALGEVLEACGNGSWSDYSQAGPLG